MISEDGLRSLAERIRVELNSTVLDTVKGTVRFTSSFGLALSQADDTNWKALYGRADGALYEAKAAGKDRVEFGRAYIKGSTMRLRVLRAAPPAHD